MLFIFSSCGLKTKPKAPANSALPSIIEQYKYKGSPKKEDEPNKKSKENK